MTACAGHQNKVKFNISTRKCKTKTIDEHKHCTEQPVCTQCTAFRGGAQGGRL